MIVASGIELRAGARLLLDGASFQVAAGDRVGLVGRNGAGKTTLLKVLAADGLPAAGSIRRSGATGYLPQDPRTGDLDMTAVDRVLSARGLDELRAGLRRAEIQMSDPDHNRADAAGVSGCSRDCDRGADYGGTVRYTELVDERDEQGAAGRIGVEAAILEAGEGGGGREVRGLHPTSERFRLDMRRWELYR